MPSTMRFLVVVLLALPISAMAQVTFGARASGLYTHLTTGGVDLGDRIGVGLTGFADRPLSDGVRLGTDVGYIQSGFVTDAILTDPTLPPGSGSGPVIAPVAVRIHYLTIAPTLSVEYPRAGLRPALSVGPRLDLRLAERTRIDGETAASDNYESLAYGGALATGIRVPLPDSRRDLRADIRYSYMLPGGALRQSSIELRVGLSL